MSTIKTRCGKTSFEERRLYKLTTDDVQMYIRKKVQDAAMLYIKNHPDGEEVSDNDEEVIATNNGKNPNKKKKKIKFTMEDAREALNFDPGMISIRYGNKFRPFMIMIDCSFMKNRQKKNNNDELSMFRPQENNSHNIRLNSFVYAVVMSFSFSDDDIQFITSPSTGNSLHLSRNSASKFRKHCHLTVTSVNNKRFVVCLLNPIDIFHDMVYDIDNPSEFYLTDVDHINDVNAYKTEYMVIRYPSKNNDNGRGKKHKGGGDRAMLARMISG